MRIHVSQYGGPAHEFGSIEEYEQFLLTTTEKLIHLEDKWWATSPAEDPARIADALDAMWDRVQLTTL